jgi:hypothetical protein
MGYDMQAVNDQTDAGYFRLNIWGMGQMLKIMDSVELVDWETSAPDWPDYPAGMSDEAYEALSRPLRARISPNPLKVPAYKFGSNDGWIVTPAECYLIAQRLRPIQEPTWVMLFRDYCAACVNKGGFEVT